MSETKERVLGDDPLDVVRVTLSRQLRRVLFEAGLVDSPELPLYDARPPSADPTPGTAGSESSQTGRAADPQRDIVAVASPVPEHAATSIPPTARGRAQVAAAGGPRHSATARAASPATTAALVEQGD